MFLFRFFRELSHHDYQRSCIMHYPSPHIPYEPSSLDLKILQHDSLQRTIFIRFKLTITILTSISILCSLNLTHTNIVSHAPYAHTVASIIIHLIQKILSIMLREAYTLCIEYMLDCYQLSVQDANSHIQHCYFE